MAEILSNNEQDSPSSEQLKTEKVLVSISVKDQKNLHEVFTTLGIEDKDSRFSQNATEIFSVIHSGDMFALVKREFKDGGSETVVMGKNKEFILEQNVIAYKAPENAFVNEGEEKVTTILGLLNRLKSVQPDLVKPNVYNYNAATMDALHRILPEGIQEGVAAWCEEQDGKVVLYLLEKGDKEPFPMFLSELPK